MQVSFRMDAWQNQEIPQSSVRIPCAGTQVYAPRYREEWLQKIKHAGVRRRAELLYQQLDGLQGLPDVQSSRSSSIPVHR